MLASLLVCLFLLASTFAHALSGTEINVLRIGKADAIIITTASHVVLIDAGEEEDAGEILTHLWLRGIDAIDVMIITHYDKDHVGGADGVLLGIPVSAVYDAAYESDKAQYLEYLDALEETGVPRHRAAQPETLTLGSLTLHLLPTALETDNDNDLSLVVSMADPYHTFLFAADAQEARIAELMEGGIGAHDVLKMPHHGRTKDNLEAFVTRVAPSIALITDSKKNPADEETLAMLSALGIETYRTLDGDIRIISGPSGLIVSQ